MIVIPMAGLSRRFTEAGYSLPKFMLPLPGGTVFTHAVSSFASHFATLGFLFVARGAADTSRFIARECDLLGVRDYSIVLLDEPTAGQAETVALGLGRAGVAESEPLTVFNIDTFRPGFRFPDAAWWDRSDGYLEVFRGSGSNWSYVRPGPADEPGVMETAEKRAISDLCCTGLYHFARAADLHLALASERIAPTTSELYVAPLYNHLIQRGRRIHYHLIAREDVVFCGVPAEYEAVRRTVELGSPEHP